MVIQEMYYEHKFIFNCENVFISKKRQVTKVTKLKYQCKSGICILVHFLLSSHNVSYLHCLVAIIY